MDLFSIFKKKETDKERFDRLVKEYFASINKEYTLKADGEMLNTNILGSDYDLGLVNLRQICFTEPHENWEAIIKDHFESLTDGIEFSTNFQKRIDDFDYIKKYLAVRIYPFDYGNQEMHENIIRREDFAATYTALVYNFPKTITTVSKKDAVAWDKTNEELFAIAIENTQKLSVPRLERVDNEKIKNVYSFEENSTFVSSNILWLPKFPEVIGNFGTVACIPHATALYAHPAENLDTLTTLNNLLHVTRSLFDKSPRPISPHVYWIFKDENIPLMVQTNEKGELSVEIPPRISALMEEMTAAQ
jgi:hypothetical protein